MNENYHKFQTALHLLFEQTEELSQGMSLFMKTIILSSHHFCICIRLFFQNPIIIPSVNGCLLCDSVTNYSMFCIITPQDFNYYSFGLHCLFHVYMVNYSLTVFICRYHIYAMKNIVFEQFLSTTISVYLFFLFL